MIWHIFKKDWKLLWPMVALVTAIQIGREWVVYRAGLFGEDPAAAALLHPLTLAWFIGIAALAAAVVHQDAIPGVDQDWLIRPISRSQLLLAKLAFVAFGISVPMFASNLVHALALGFPLVPSLESVFYKELFVFVCLVVPVMALASTSRNMTELVIIGAALIVAFSSSLILSAFLFGANWCPTCNSGMSWLQHLVQHVGILVGAGVILGLQYYGRRSDAARIVAVIGAIALVFAQLSWGTAFAVERWITRASGAGNTIELGFGEPEAGGPEASAHAPGSRQTAQMLLHGRVDQAVEYWRRRARPANAPVTIDLPMRITGVTADQLILADRIETHLFGGDGRLLYRGDNAGAFAALLTPYPGGSGQQPQATVVSLDIPGKVYRQAAEMPSRLKLNYSLTLMKLVGEHKLSAFDGELRSTDVGVCATQADKNAAYLRCNTIGQAPFCYSATLYGPDGRHNPEVLKCTPDYRRHLPAFMDVVGFYGIDMPLRDKNGLVDYEIDATRLDAAYVLIKIYGESDHFERNVVARTRLAHLRSQRE